MSREEFDESSTKGIARASRYSRISARDKRQHRTNYFSRARARPSQPSQPRRRRASAASAQSQPGRRDGARARQNQLERGRQRAIKTRAEHRGPAPRGSRNRCVQPVGALDDQLNPQPCAHRAHEFSIAIRLSTANPMIEMRSNQAEAQSLAKIEQRAGKRDRIRAAGKPNENRRASTQPRSQERRLDRVDHLFFSVAIHHDEIIPGSAPHQTRYAIRTDHVASDITASPLLRRSN